MVECATMFDPLRPAKSVCLQVDRQNIQQKIEQKQEQTRGVDVNATYMCSSTLSIRPPDTQYSGTHEAVVEKHASLDTVVDRRPRHDLNQKSH